MRFQVALAALAILLLAAGIGGNDDSITSGLCGWGLDRTGRLHQRADSRLPDLGVVDATPDWLVRGLLPGGGIWVAGERVVVELADALQQYDDSDGNENLGWSRSAHDPYSAPSEEAVGELSEEAQQFTARLTIYCCKGDPGGVYCGLTASGVQVAPGMAACSLYWPFGTRFRLPSGTIVVCEDRGSAVTSRNHLDVFFWDCGGQQNPEEGTGWAWLQKVGTQVEVEVIEP